MQRHRDRNAGEGEAVILLRAAVQGQRPQPVQHMRSPEPADWRMDRLQRRGELLPRPAPTHQAAGGVQEASKAVHPNHAFLGVFVLRGGTITRHGVGMACSGAQLVNTLPYVRCVSCRRRSAAATAALGKGHKQQRDVPGGGSSLHCGATLHAACKLGRNSQPLKTSPQCPAKLTHPAALPTSPAA